MGTCRQKCDLYGNLIQGRLCEKLGLEMGKLINFSIN